MKKAFLSVCAMVGLTVSIQAQTIEKSNVYKYSPRNSGYIFDNNSLAGYYNYYATEKVDKKNLAYAVDLYDNNLNEAKSFEVVRNKKSVLLESVFNKNAFMFMFFDGKDELEFVTYDAQKFTDLPKWEKYRIQESQLDPDAENTTVFPLDGEGFVRQTFTKNDKIGYEIVAYDNNMKTMWTYGSNPKSDMIETADVMYTSANYVAIGIIKKKNKMTKNFDSYFAVVDAKTGKELFNIPVRDKNDGEMSVLNCFVDEEKSEIMLVGEYYKPGDEVLKDNSLGLYARNMDMNGSDIAFKKYGWASEIANFKKKNMSAEEKDADKGKSYIWFHKFVKTAEGNIIGVGEQYRKQVSALGVASTVMSGSGGSGASNFEIKITNMVTIELDKNLELKDWTLTKKKTSRVVLPQGYGLQSPQVMAYYIKARGYFDYQFTSSDTKKDMHQFVYTDLNRKEEKKGEKADVMIGVITVNGGEMTTQRVPVKTEARRVWYLPAKPGYIMIGEYFRKEKKIVMHLEKLTY
jgi:hypothetical protein